MSYPRIVNAIMHAPWAIHRPMLGSLFSLMHSKLGEGGVPPESMFAGEQFELAARLRHGSGSARFCADRWGRLHTGALVNHSARIHAEALKRCGGNYAAYETITREEESKLGDGQILHIFGSGVIGKHLSSMEELCAGGLSVDRIQQALKAAQADDNISAIVLQLDTPGGMCYGCPETAALVDQLRATKHVVAYCDSLTASAGYWITARADYFYIAPSADLGSIGVYCAVTDYTEWCAKNGLKVTVFADGTHKGAGVPGTSLSEDQIAKIKADVAACGKMFRADVTAGRGDRVTAETMQGQTFMGEEAIKAGLADALAPDLDTVLADVAKAISAPSR